MNSKSFKRVIVFALLSALGFTASIVLAGTFLEPPDIPRWPTHYLQEGRAISMDLPVEQAGNTWVVLASPSHGSVLLSVGAVVYEPSAGYFGRDQLTLLDPSSGRTLTFELRVLPRYLALAGRFVGDSQGAALYDSLKQEFLLCSAVVVSGEPMSCHTYQVVGLESGAWVPVAWQEDGARDLPALVDLATGRMSLLVPGEDGYCRVVERFDLQVAPGGWPVLGDWDGSGEPNLVLVYEDGRVLELVDKSWQEWPKRVQVTPGDELLWPFLIPNPESDDALAVVDPETGNLTWLSYSLDKGSRDGFEKSVRGGDFRRPLNWIDAPVWPWQPVAGVFYLEQASEGLEVITGHYLLGAPHTIPIKFPDDPPGG